jgi:hypothetical protein
MLLLLMQVFALHCIITMIFLHFLIMHSHKSGSGKYDLCGFFEMLLLILNINLMCVITDNTSMIILSAGGREAKPITLHCIS